MDPSRVILVAVGEPETIPTGSASLCREHLSVYTANQDLRGLEIRTTGKYKYAALSLIPKLLCLHIWKEI